MLCKYVGVYTEEWPENTHTLITWGWMETKSFPQLKLDETVS